MLEEVEKWWHHRHDHGMFGGMVGARGRTYFRFGFGSGATVCVESVSCVTPDNSLACKAVCKSAAGIKDKKKDNF
jgi:hypothetical protein